MVNNDGSSIIGSSGDIEEVLFQVREDTDEDIEGQKIYWESVLDEAVYSEHDFEKRNFNIIRDMKIRLYEISETHLEERDEPYNHWEADDFVVLEEMLEAKIDEVSFFMNICAEMKKANDWMNSMSDSKKKWEEKAVDSLDEEEFDMVSDFYDKENDKGILLEMFLKLLDRRIRVQKFSKDVVVKMKKGLENFYKSITK